MNVSAVLVTRGDVDLSPVLSSLPSDWPVVIWNNSERQNLSVYGRYAALAEVETPLVYIQDDDCIVGDPEQIVWESSNNDNEYGHLVCNMPPQFRPHYSEHALVGFGSCFHRDAPKRAFERYAQKQEIINQLWPPEFLRTCDIVFTALTPRVLVDIPVENLPWATGPDRMYREPQHVGERKRMLELALKVRDL